MTSDIPPDSSPVARVLAAITDGADSRKSIAAAAGLSEDLTSAIVDQLVRLGRLKRESLPLGCPPSGCGDCPTASAADSGQCSLRFRGTAPRIERSGLVVLSVEPPEG